MNISDFVVVTLYPNGEMGRDADGIWFRSVSPVVFQMQPDNTLEELKCVLLRNMGAAGAMSVRRVAYRLRSIKLISRWARRYNCCAHTDCDPGGGDDDSDEDFVGNTDESSESSDGSEFVPESQARQGFLLPAPSPIPDLSSVDCHFHTLSLDEMTKVQREGFGGGGEDYGLDGGSEFQIGHRFSTREAVHMAVKNYNIRRASEYRMVESDPYKYVCRCK
ncbi:hypothetical protein PIB30_069995 [Stylosanthes scabra]|uniref:Transposase MuDR plant domain-containing protein n=1 Tax=Stylosanthes scabra TaxID=79078 RepID=A0ABU6ZM51_9FABA|nr:hypothetical protein [Stylosanthes scabra]